MATVRNTNDGTNREPYLRTDINYANVKGLPANSSAPKGDDRALHEAVKRAGYQGIQGGDLALCRELGLGATGGGRVNQPEDATAIAREGKAKGYDCVTLHVGWGMEDDDEVHRLVEAVLNASAQFDLPMYIETHRATITQDIWRTVKLTEWFPEVRFNGDFSHWYAGLEMVYGNIEAKFDFLQPVFDRVRFFHGRISSSGCIQVDIGDGTGRLNVAHFREMWTRSMVAFLRSAQPGDFLCFTPELLGPEINYARLIPAQTGEWVEESDRWQQALLYTRIAQECWAEARQKQAH
ncbi:MAG: hypothetical protein M1546_14720 [Chloroflexi bacterium]|nr:hypothetical protein [Chloroflexota bacterium]